MVRRFMIIALFVLTATACTLYRKELDTNPPFAPHHFRYFDLQVDWRAERTATGVRLSGTVTNRRDYYLRFLELTARLLDEKGTIVARGTFSDFPTYLPPGKSEPFRLELPLPAGSTAERVHFTYVYWLVEAPPAFRGESDKPDFGSFESPL